MKKLFLTTAKKGRGNSSLLIKNAAIGAKRRKLNNGDAEEFNENFQIQEILQQQRNQFVQDDPNQINSQ